MPTNPCNCLIFTFHWDLPFFIQNIALFWRTLSPATYKIFKILVSEDCQSGWSLWHGYCNQFRKKKIEESEANRFRRGDGSEEWRHKQAWRSEVAKCFHRLVYCFLTDLLSLVGFCHWLCFNLNTTAKKMKSSLCYFLIELSLSSSPMQTRECYSISWDISESTLSLGTPTRTFEVGWISCLLRERIQPLLWSFLLLPLWFASKIPQSKQTVCWHSNQSQFVLIICVFPV